ncbi:hypothetical protein EZV62_006894 [Acer yangbiense]|uniref:Uncharacterized protein n=1 Tax=Acer yangbiense TaxID=1000413 RepID=A0A5C7IA43_9ROSI|nr:hypothetical protein EZV62_006894 [Acer yangbiense]
MSVEVSGGGACVGSSDRSGGNNVGDEWRIGIDQNEEFSEREKKQFDSFDEVLEVVNKIDQPAVAKSKIQKIPSMLRDNHKFKKYFEPNVFSFGPYYHPHCTREMAKQIKVILADDFLKKNDKDHELAWMFLVDGCAILQFMYISTNYLADLEVKLKKLRINFDYEKFLEQDLFLLENQLPYQLLLLIIRCTSNQDKLLESIYKFIFISFGTQSEWKENKNKILKDLNHNDHVHLLDLLRKMHIQQLHQKDHEKCGLREIISGWIVILFDKLKSNRNESDRDRLPVPFRNIGKLKEAGINLKRSKTRCVTDFSFSYGTLKLPPIILEESTTIMFLNMLGYEMCPDYENEFEIVTYMYFMGELINRTQDVEELRKKNILHDELVNDEEVVKLFNEISTHLIPNLDYHNVKSDIGDYFDNKWVFVVIESDSLSAVSWVNGVDGVGNVRFLKSILEIREILSRLKSKVVVRFGSKSGNAVADFLAKQGAVNGLDQMAWSS